MKKFLFISGFNDSQPEQEKKIFEHLLNRGVEVEKIDYYKCYNCLRSRNIVEQVTDRVISAYYENGCEPLNIIGYSLGGAILVEVLNTIYIMNSNRVLDENKSEIFEKKRMAVIAFFRREKRKIKNNPHLSNAEKATKMEELRQDRDYRLENFCKNIQIEVGKTILISPARYIVSPKDLLASYMDPTFYQTKEAKIINNSSKIPSPKATYHLFNIAHNVNKKRDDGNDSFAVLREYGTEVIFPNRDQWVRVLKTTEKLNEVGVSQDQIRSIGSYGHLAPVIPEAVDEMILKLRR